MSDAGECAELIERLRAVEKTTSLGGGGYTYGPDPLTTEAAAALVSAQKQIEETRADALRLLNEIGYMEAAWREAERERDEARVHENMARATYDPMAAIHAEKRATAAESRAAKLEEALRDVRKFVWSGGDTVAIIAFVDDVLSQEKNDG